MKRLLREAYDYVLGLTALVSATALSVALLLSGSAFAQVTQDAQPLRCREFTQPQIVELPAALGTLYFSLDEPEAWLELTEHGQTVSVSAAKSAVLDVSQPLRFGQHWTHLSHGDVVSLRRATPNGAVGAIGIRLHCDTTENLTTRIAWLRAASEAGLELANTGRKPLSHWLIQIQTLEDSSPDASAHALSLHYRAMAYAVAGKNSEAGAAFEAAESAWRSLNDEDRATAARLGRVEALRLTEANRDVLNLVPPIEHRSGALTYFSVRLAMARCQVLQAQGLLNDASLCFSWGMTAYKALGETTEYVVALQNYAKALGEQGHIDDAQQLVTGALTVPTGPAAPRVRGFLRVQLSDLAMRRGQITESLRNSNFALEEFARLPDTSRWQATTLFGIADVYAQLGANDESLAALEQATSRISARDAPERMASAMSLFANIEENAHHPESSLLWRRAAERVQENLGLRLRAKGARLLRWQQQLALGDYDAVELELTADTDVYPLYDNQQSLLWAELLLARHRMDDAGAKLRGLNSERLSLPLRVRYALLSAKYEESSHSAQDSLATLFGAVQHLDSLATQTSSQTLASLIARQSIPLRRSAISLILRNPNVGASRMDMLWPWLETVTARTADPASPSAENFNRAVAADLLTTQSTKSTPVDARAQRELLSLLAPAAAVSNTATGRTRQPTTLASLQQLLAPDSAFLAYLDGESRGGVLWITRESARVLDAAAPEAVRASTLALRTALRTPATPLGEVQATAQTLSTQLLGALPVGTPPKHLYVLADEMMSRVAWSTLTWPGQSAPLIETTAVEFVHLVRDDAARANVQAHAMHLIVSSQDQFDAAPLRRLANASTEPQLIRAALASPDPSSARPALILAEGAQATREAVLTALDDPGAWVHVAAHGTAQPHRIGYAGLWLAPSPAENVTATNPPTQIAPAENQTQLLTQNAAPLPAFLSWLDILERGVRADLVVLNACQLGDSGMAINGNRSFADAVSRAGARQVVAAAWPVSDAAAALWVPEFYTALAADPEHNAANALHAAQLRLRASRAFAHPFFWAGMQATTRLGLSAASVASPASTQH